MTFQVFTDNLQIICGVSGADSAPQALKMADQIYPGRIKGVRLCSEQFSIAEGTPVLVIKREAGF